MVDQLKDLTSVLAALPDNQAGLITPQNVREAVICLVSDGITATLEPPVPITVGLAAGGGWTDLTLAVAAQLNGDESIWWDLDANGRAGPGAYPASIELAAGELRNVSCTGTLAAEPAGNYVVEVQLTLNGAPLGDIALMEAGGAIDYAAAILLHGELLEYATIPRIGMQARRQGGAAGSLDVFNLELRTIGRPDVT